MTYASFGNTQVPIDLPSPSRQRWQLLRAGLQNVWEYDDQRFVFTKGRLLLRGSNEAGKTKALELLLPFLLDASLDARRLDPFGTSARPMRWNLLNEENTEIQVRLGYIWLEFGKLVRDVPEFITIGAGLRAKRSNPGMDVWYFITPKRVDVDLQLLGTNRVPLSKINLTSTLEPSGSVFDHKSDYRRSVNQHLFGLSPEQYDALIEALLQLRRPQLSKQLNTSDLSNILQSSLPPLDPSVVIPLAEGFERLDRDRDERDELQRTLKQLSGLNDQYKTYIGIVAKTEAQVLTRAESTYQNARAKLREAESALEEAVASESQLQKDVQQNENELADVRARKEILHSSDEFRQIQNVESARRQADDDEQLAEKTSVRLGRERAELERRQQAAQAAIEEQCSKESRLVFLTATASDLAAKSDFRQDHASICTLLSRDDPDAASGLLRVTYETRIQGCRKITEAEQLLSRAELKLNEKKRLLEHATQVVRDKEEALNAA